MKHNRGWDHKTGIKIYIFHPINLHGGDFGFITNLTKVKYYGKDRLNQSKAGIR